MTKRAILVLEDGSIYEGNTFGAEVTAYGRSEGWLKMPKMRKGAQ